MIRLLLLIALFMPVADAQEEVQVPDTDMSLIYGVTRAGEVAFRAEPKEASEILGYFPGHQAVWVVRTNDHWGLIHLDGISGWVPRDGIITNFTINPETKLPE